MREVKNRHHIFPRSRVNAKDILGVCESKSQQKKLYRELVIEVDDIVFAFNFFNETFWGRHFEVQEVYYDKIKQNGKKKKWPSKVEIQLRRRRKKNSTSVCRISKEKHQTYHLLFGNMMPWEAFDRLNKIFWNNAFIVKEQLKKAVV
jgi:hypothetical protein